MIARQYSEHPSKEEAFSQELELSCAAKTIARAHNGGNWTALVQTVLTLKHLAGGTAHCHQLAEDVMQKVEKLDQLGLEQAVQRLVLQLEHASGAGQISELREGSALLSNESSLECTKWQSAILPQAPKLYMKLTPYVLESGIQLLHERGSGFSDPCLQRFSACSLL